MIKTSDAIRAARSLIGTPYAELDCINLIKKVIRKAPGGVKGYTTAGTNSLWDSYGMSAKYRDLTERHEGLAGIPAGALPFKRYGADDEGHVGIATGEGTVIHSSSVKGMVVETPLTAAEGWDCWGVHRYIETAGNAVESEGNMSVLYKARVVTEKDPLRVRDYPATGRILGHVPKGETVEVLEELDNGWAKIRYNELEGYASVIYLGQIEATEEAATHEPMTGATAQLVIRDSAGNEFRPVGECTMEVEITLDGV